MGNFKARRLRNLSSADIAWVAGLLEGEGSFILAGRNRKSPRISMQSTDEDVLLALVSTLGAGSVTRVSQRPGRKPCWGFALSGRLDIELLLRQIWPHMGARRRGQIDRLIEVIESMET